MIKKQFVLKFLILFMTSYIFGQKNTENLSSIFETIKLLSEKQEYKTIISKNIPKEFVKNTNDSLTFAKILHLQGDALYYTQSYFESQNYYNKGIKYSPNNEDGINEKCRLLLDRAYAEENLQMEETSYNSTKSAEILLSNLKNPDLNFLFDIYIKLSIDAAFRNFYEEGELYLGKAWELYNKNKPWRKEYPGNASKNATCLYKSIYLYHLKGDEKKLLNYLKYFETLKTLSSFNDIENLMYAASLNCIGDFYINHKNKFDENMAFKNAELYLNKALAALDKDKHPSNYIQFLFNKTKLLRFSKKFKEALKSNFELTRLADKNDQRMPFFLGQKTMIFLDSYDKNNAFKSYKNMLSLIHSDSSKLKEDFSNFKPSTVINHTGLIVEIADTFNDKFPNDSLVLKKTAAYYNLALIQLQNSYQQEVYNDRIKDYYNKTISGILKARKLGYNKLDYKSILNTIENIENKLTWKAFLKNRNSTKIALPDSIFEYERFSRNELVKARKNNDTLRISELTNNIKNNNTIVQKQFPTISKYVYSEFKIENLQNKLDSETLIIKYKKVDSLLYAFFISKSNITLKTVNFSNNTISNIEKYLSIVKNKKSDKVLAQNLFNVLIPFKISEYKNITIIQDDILHHLPFETLVNNSQYLISNFSINYASYLAFINYETDIKTGLDDLFIFSPSYYNTVIANERNESQQLLGAQNEALAISKLFNNIHFDDAKATKYNFLNFSNQANILHLAMHGNIDNEKPELSYFEFYGDSINSKLYLEELYALKLKAHLAVLSACNTGSDISKNHLGNVSLQRAFTLAGVPATLSSLWNVPDKATETIMIRFYDNLKLGLSKSEALQKAKKDYIASQPDENLSSPYFWAGFVISGDTSPIIAKSNSHPFLWTLVIIAISTLLLYILFQRIKKR
jgi:CHAT domain-containing protein